jgi:hypothetical protein
LVNRRTERKKEGVGGGGGGTKKIHINQKEQSFFEELLRKRLYLASYDS